MILTRHLQTWVFSQNFYSWYCKSISYSSGQKHFVSLFCSQVWRSAMPWFMSQISRSGGHFSEMVIYMPTPPRAIVWSFTVPSFQTSKEVPEHFWPAANLNVCSVNGIQFTPQTSFFSLDSASVFTMPYLHQDIKYTLHTNAFRSNFNDKCCYQRCATYLIRCGRTICLVPKH